MRLRALLIMLSALATPAQARMPPDFVDAMSIVPGLIADMRYAGSHNFVGRPIDGYRAPRCLLTRAAAEALASVQRDLAPAGLGLKVYDCYRPVRAVAHFVRWAKDARDVIGKAEFYPDLDKGALFRLGFIAARSSHSRGSTVDLTLVDRASKAEIPMGGPFDFFGSVSYFAARDIGPDARANRDRLRAAMQARGFEGYDKEWWHFTLRAEPYPHTAFDVPVDP